MRRILIIAVFLTLSGCAEKSRFDCPYGSGPSCLSMSEIDKNIKTNATIKPACTRDSCRALAKKTVAAAAATLQATSDAQPARRVPETVLQMWVSPYEANTGIYYQASFVNIIVKDAAWQAPVLDDASNRENYNG